MLPAYEDAFYYMWKERRLPSNVDPLKSNLKNKMERDRIARIFETGLNEVAGYVMPLERKVMSDGPRWMSGPWFLREETLFLLPGYLVGPMTPVDGHNVWLILYAGIPASIITTFLWMRAIRQIGASQASIFINLMPVFSALIAMALLGERIAAYHLAGGALVLAGVIMAQTLTRPLRQRPAGMTHPDVDPR